MTHPTKIYWLDATTTMAKLRRTFIENYVRDTFAVKAVVLINK